MEWVLLYLLVDGNESWQERLMDCIFRSMNSRQRTDSDKVIVVDGKVKIDQMVVHVFV